MWNDLEQSSWHDAIFLKQDEHNWWVKCMNREYQFIFTPKQLGLWKEKIFVDSETKEFA